MGMLKVLCQVCVILMILGLFLGCDEKNDSLSPTESDARYLPVNGKAADSALLEGKNAANFAKQSDLEETRTEVTILETGVSGIQTQLTDVSDNVSANYYTVTQSDDTFATKSQVTTVTDNLTANYFNKTQANQTFALITALTAATDRIADLEERLDKKEDHRCPPDYEVVSDLSIKATGYYCRKAVGDGNYDDMVKVGDFWIDRYENSIWNSNDCTGTQYGEASDNWTSSGATGANADQGFFPRNGNWTSPLFACSLLDVTPTRWVTFFQAQAACALSGKSLATNGQWQAAAQGTIVSECNTGGSGIDGYNGADPEHTGSLNGPGTKGCISNWGTSDMVGNVWEWADLWGQAGRDMEIAQGEGLNPWPTGYGSDGTWNLNGEAYDGGNWWEGLPAAALRGGNWNDGARAGVFALLLDQAPSGWSNGIGFRCAIK